MIFICLFFRIGGGFFEKVHTENLHRHSGNCIRNGACVVYAAKVPARDAFADVDCTGFRINIETVAALLGRFGGSMQIVIWKSPKALSGILRAVFGMKKK